MREINIGADMSSYYHALLTSYKTGVSLVKNGICLDNEFAKGKIDAFLLSDGIAIFRTDVWYAESVRFRHTPVHEPVLYAIACSVGETPGTHAFMLPGEGDEDKHPFGLSSRYSVHYFSTDIQSKYETFPAGVIKAILITFDTHVMHELQEKLGTPEHASLFSKNKIKGYAAMTAAMIDKVTLLMAPDLQPDLQKLYCLGAVYELIAMLEQQVKEESERIYQSTGVAEAARLLQIRNLMLHDFSKGCPLMEDMAHEANMSLAKFKIVFKQLFKMPYYQYYQHYRLSAARQNLLLGKTVTETAYEFGFSNAAHFTLTFKKKFNMLPSALR
jgi:AraC-like DNA-binding protein